MALNSILRRRQSLVWEVREAIQYEKQSPFFFLKNSKWILKIVPKYYPDKDIPLSYAIVLKKCFEGQIFEPFEVFTSLEDRRSNAQFHCSKLIISSACETSFTLFKDSLDSIYKKFPGLKTYNEVAVVCTFYASSDLALSIESTKGLSLRIRHSLEWKTGKPTMYQNRESVIFNIKNSKWKLQIWLTNSMRPCPSNFQIYLTNISGIQLLEPFEVKTFLEDSGSNSQIHCSSLVVSSSREVLYKASIDTLYEKLPDLKLHDDLAIICTFGRTIESASMKEKKNDIEVTLEHSQLLNTNNHFQNNSLINSSSIDSSSQDLFRNLESLSEDFSYLLDNKFMADIQLKIGDDVIPVHKAILNARSQIFRSKIEKEFGKSNSSIIEIDDIEPSVLRMFLGYLYSGKITEDLSADMLCNLYKASVKYVEPILRKLCSCYITTRLHPDNFIKFLVLSQEHSDQELKDAIANFIIEKPGLTLKPDWINFRKEFPDLAIEIYQKHMEKTISK